MEEKRLIQLTINGDVYDILATPSLTLLEALREKAFLTGTKRGCDVGACGACTVILDGQAILACLTLAVEAEGRSIRTVESLSQGGKLSPVQESFVDLGALQCGFCTPGLVMGATALLEEDPNPPAEEVKRKLAGNLCRCTGYVKVLDAVQDAAAKLQGGRP